MFQLATFQDFFLKVMPAFLSIQAACITHQYHLGLTPLIILYHVDPSLVAIANEQVPKATNQLATIRELLEAVFSVIRAAAVAMQRRSKHVSSPTSPRERGCYIRTITASVQLQNKITGRDSQGACRQDELIGGKPPLGKKL
jgi:hypothetical protein